MEILEQSIPERYFISKITKKHIPTWLQEKMQYIEHNVSLMADQLMDQGATQTINLQKSSKINHNSGETQSLVRSRILNLKKQEKQLIKQLNRFDEQKKKKKQRKTHNIVISKPLTNRQLRQLTKNYQQFVKQLELKSKFLKIQEQQWKFRQDKDKRQEMKVKSNQKRLKAAEKLKQMEKRRRNRELILEQEKKVMKRLRKKKLYEKMQQNFNQEQNSAQYEKSEQFQRERAMMSVDLENLSLHEQQYKKILQERQSKRDEINKQSRLYLPSVSPYKSKFYHNVLEEQRNQLESIQNRKKQAHLLNRIHRQYEQRVLKEFSPETRPLPSNHSRNTKPKKGLSKEQRKKIGNQYYSLGQSRAKSIQQQKQNIDQQFESIQSTQFQNAKKYPNYLPTILKQNNINRDKVDKYKQCQKKVRKILADDSRQFNDKLEEIQYHINQAYPVDELGSPKDESILMKVRAKMQLLEMIN